MANELDVLSSELVSSLDETLLAICQTEMTGKGLANGQVVAVLDVQGLACPMPLLKAKVALRSMTDGQALYLLASDKNSQTDLYAFCQKHHHTVQTWTAECTNGTIFHFIIIKNGEK